MFGAADKGAEWRETVPLGCIFSYLPWTRESVSGRKDRHLSKLESRLEKRNSFCPSENLKIRMAATDNRGPHLYQAFWLSKHFPMCSLTYSDKA